MTTRYWIEAGVSLLFGRPPNKPFITRRGQSFAPTEVVLAADHEREVAEKDEQWRKTNAEYERVSKENGRLLVRVAEKDKRIAELEAALKHLEDVRAI